jgi:hypothetical protein
MGDTLIDDLTPELTKDLEQFEAELVKGLELPPEVWEKYKKLTHERIEKVASAGEDALNEINKVCGCKSWEYPGQLVRDVKLLKELSEELANKVEAFITDNEAIFALSGNGSLGPMRDAVQKYRTFFKKDSTEACKHCGQTHRVCEGICIWCERKSAGQEP